ncbi:MAG TPA: chloride channel protein [Nitrospirota bacterium]
MKKKITEETVLFISIIKWVILSSVMGMLTGLSTTAFLKALAWGIETGRGFPYYILLPAGLFANALALHYIYPSADAHTTDKVIASIHSRGKITLPSVLKVFFLPILTIASYGSAGKEAPAADIGAGIGSLIGERLKFTEIDRRKLMICGVSAGFASVFGTPIAGAIFGIEVLFVGALLYDVMLPSFIAGIVSYQVSSSFGVTYFYHPLAFAPVFSRSFFLFVVIAGVFFGLCSLLLVEIMKAGKKFSGRLAGWPPLKGLLAGAVMVVLSLLVSDRFLGLGLDTVESCLRGENAPWYAFLMKPVFTSLTLGFSGSGGIVTPVFFTGASAGALFGRVSGLDIATFSALGLVSVLAGAANTPIAAAIMSIELFGAPIAPYAAVACVISFLMTGHRSVYPSQVLSVRKSTSIEVEIGKELKHIEAEYEARERSLVGRLTAIAGTIKSIIRR